MSETPVNQKQLTVKRSLTKEEKDKINRLKEYPSYESQPFFRSQNANGKECLELSLDESLENDDAIDLMDTKLLDCTGSANGTVSLRLLTTAGKAIVPVNAKTHEFAKELDIIALSMQSLAPHDEYEGQLVAQLVVLHEHALNWLGRAIRTERVDFANTYLNGASKLLSRHHETLEALLKYRRKGEQRVHVEHVHVHDGGQAIVGHVSTGGGGLNKKVEEGPHAKV